ncbi:mannose 6-phosphate receptor domain-containing protein [Tothia fuscella]|uniref:Mannose 6-phosphate receptor domain-containing protein n=1 Tax=Tothia fuscella TaxID=1048955 RepID=A0A9P4NWT0_9PEZI|nr:mannose 6-phosphate receptor domain-containing protein [Tothia fuscella]
MKLFNTCILCAFLTTSTTLAATADDKKTKAPKPCTIRSPSSGAFFDLSAISIQLPPKKKEEDKKKESTLESWHAKGYDYGSNFTLNFCAPVVESLEDVEGVDKGLWRNVSAFYTQGKRTYSIGQQNSELVFRGSKLVLNYTNGSPCATSSKKRSAQLSHNVEDLTTRAFPSDDDDDDDDDHDKHSKKPNHKEKVRRKSTIISLLCQKEVLGPKAPKATVAFIGASEDQCTYFFEARSQAACAGIETTPQQLGPGGVFGVIMMIAIMVYLVGGCFYQRTVMHQRGWYQLPNHSMWAGIWNFLTDAFIILTSSCARFLPSRRGYSRVSLNGNGNIRGRHSEDENRLIDQLDEEWDD